MEMDKTIAWSPMARDLVEIHRFDVPYGVQCSEDLKEIFVASVMKQPAGFEKKIQDLKEEEEAQSKAAFDETDETESRISSLEEAVKDNRINQKKEMKEFDENHAKNTTKLEEKIDTEIEKAKQGFEKDFAKFNESLDLLNRFMTIPKTSPRCFLSYIGRVCLDLQANMYYEVLPDQFVEDLPYKVKDIEEDIDAEDLLNDEEREEASKKWEDLKKELGWDPSLERTLEMLEEKGNPMDRTGLTVEESERAADELHKQGRLTGLTSYEKVKQIIEMWKKLLSRCQNRKQLISDEVKT